ncbi:MAG TPA: STAS domain-containing protein [Terriglobales bacterium]|nr:STAS domain-containing protein [Terriglobales bacterium]
MHSSGSVIVMQAPERLDHTGAAMFLERLKPLLEDSRPRLVLDFSEIRHIDSAGVEMLLLCMEEAMKRDGDVKLAAVPPSSAVILELMKVDRLFEIFDTPEEAVRSFHNLSSYEIPADLQWFDGSPGDLEATR